MKRYRLNINTFMENVGGPVLFAIALDLPFIIALLIL